MDPIVTAACELLAEGRAFVLATIIHQQGSTPRTSGTRMLVTARQQIVGTIGGGLLELETMQAAARMNAQTSLRILTFDLTNHQAARMDMICGGRVQVLLDFIPANDENRALFNCWREELSQGRRAMLISVVAGLETAEQRIAHMLLKGGHPAPDDWKLPAALLEKWTHLSAGASHVQVFHEQDCLVVADPGQIAATLFLFGAGHVARPTSHLAAMVGFDVVVLDDRPEFANDSRFPEAAAVHVIAGFDSAFEGLTVGRDSYIVIVTRGHLHDRTVLAQALKTPAAYIGMIGSRRKRDTLFRSLLEEGYKENDLARVHSPIGLTIGADTPEEIAVSIAAELIAVRAGVQP